MGFHADLTGADLHEPKGVENATAGQIYVADGLGSGSWTTDFVALMEGDNTQWDDYVVPLVGVTVPAGLTAPALTKIADNGSGSRGVYAQAFSASAINDLTFTIQMPHRYKAGTAVKPHIHWEVPDANSGNVVWQLEYVIAPYDTAYTTTTVDTITVAAIGAAKKQYISAFADIPGTSLAESTLIHCRLARVGNDGNDTYASVTYGDSFDIHFQVEKAGTDEEYPT